MEAQQNQARKNAAAPAAAGGVARRQRLWRDLALIAIAPLLLYLLASLVTFSPDDPGWSHSGSVTAPLHNFGGIVGAWIADVLLYLCGYVAFLLPFMLGLIAWIALFGMDSDGDGDADLGPGAAAGRHRRLPRLGHGLPAPAHRRARRISRRAAAASSASSSGVRCTAASGRSARNLFLSRCC